MDDKTKKCLLITSVILVLIVAAYMFYIFNSSNDLEFRSGAYYCEISIINENNAAVHKWNVGISRSNVKHNLVESENNKEILEKFRKTIVEISSKRFNLVLLVSNLVFTLIAFVTVSRDSQLYKKGNDEKFFQLLTMLILVFLVYKITISFIQLNRLHKNIIYYFNSIK